MASTLIKSVEAVRVCFTIENINENIQYVSSPIYVRDLPWTISLNKEAGCIVSPMNELRPNSTSKWPTIFKWINLARVTVKILSPQTDEELYKVCTGPCLFSSDEMALAKASLFSWEELIKPEMRYINDKRCVLEVLIEAGPLQSGADDEWLTINTIQAYCKLCSQAGFQFKVVKSNGFFGFCSPEFSVQNVKFRAAVVKSENKLKVQLYKMRDTTFKQHGKITYRCIFSSFDPRKKAEAWDCALDNSFTYQSELCYLNVCEIEWSKLTNLMERFVFNNSFMIDLVINVESDGGMEKVNQRQLLNLESSLRLECPVCMEDMIGKPISSTRCGHVFHSGCVSECIKTRPICPVCKSPRPKIHNLYLPLK